MVYRAAVLRIALGSATVAAITAGGIAGAMTPLRGLDDGYRGRFRGVIFSHVNDPGSGCSKSISISVSARPLNLVDAGNDHLHLRPDKAVCCWVWWFKRGGL